MTTQPLAHTRTGPTGIRWGSGGCGSGRTALTAKLPTRICNPIVPGRTRMLSGNNAAPIPITTLDTAGALVGGSPPTPAAAGNPGVPQWRPALGNRRAGWLPLDHLWSRACLGLSVPGHKSGQPAGRQDDGIEPRRPRVRRQRARARSILPPAGYRRPQLHNAVGLRLSGPDSDCTLRPDYRCRMPALSEVERAPACPNLRRVDAMGVRSNLPPRREDSSNRLTKPVESQALSSMPPPRIGRDPTLTGDPGHTKLWVLQQFWRLVGRHGDF